MKPLLCVVGFWVVVLLAACLFILMPEYISYEVIDIFLYILLFVASGFLSFIMYDIAKDYFNDR